MIVTAGVCRPGSRAGSSTGCAATGCAPGTRRAMTEADYAALITAAHRYLAAPVIVIWDNLPTHLSNKCAPSPPATRTG